MRSLFSVQKALLPLHVLLKIDQLVTKLCQIYVTLDKREDSLGIWLHAKLYQAHPIVLRHVLVEYARHRLLLQCQTLQVAVVDQQDNVPHLAPIVVQLDVNLAHGEIALREKCPHL